VDRVAACRVATQSSNSNAPPAGHAPIWLHLIRHLPHLEAALAGRIGEVELAQDGESFGFIIYDAKDRACVYIGYPTQQQADIAAQHAQALLVGMLACERL
jgi:hypothetical protein